MQNKMLKGRIIERYGTISAFADELGCSPTNVRRVMSSDSISSRTMDAWGSKLGISRSQYGKFFFNTDVAKQ